MGLGDNSTGQLGDDTQVDSSSIPRKLVGMADITGLAAGSLHALAALSLAAPSARPPPLPGERTDSQWSGFLPDT